MATWNELFLDERYIAEIPQQEVHKFVKKIEGTFSDRPLSIWDLCCGAGRHTVLISQMGHKVYGSDISENGISHTKNWLGKNGLSAVLKISDMTKFPFDGVKFHGVVCWDALHHNTIENIQKSVDTVYKNLTPGGMFMLSLLSTKSGSYGRGKEIEKDTFVTDFGSEEGVPHHYFDEKGIKGLFQEWEFVYLVEHVCDYIAMEPDGFETNPFSYTKWNILVKK